MEDSVRDVQIHVMAYVHYHVKARALPDVVKVALQVVLGRVELHVTTIAVIIHALQDVIVIVVERVVKTALLNVVTIVNRIVRVFVLIHAKIRVKMDAPHHVQVHADLRVPVEHLAIVNISQ